MLRGDPAVKRRPVRLFMKTDADGDSPSSDKTAPCSLSRQNKVPLPTTFVSRQHTWVTRPTYKFSRQLKRF